MGILSRLFHRKGTDKESKDHNGKLVLLARIVRGQIAVYGVDNVRKHIIKSIDDDCRRVAERVVKIKGESTTLGDILSDKIVISALNTPEYMTMLQELNLGPAHITVAAREAMIEAKQKAKHEGAK